MAFKRAFTAYYLELRSPGIADPTRAFAAGYDYLSALLEGLGPVEFMHRLDDETTHLAGRIEQDLRRPARGARGAGATGRGPAIPDHFTFDDDDLEDRLRECFEYAWNRLQDEGRLQEERR